MMERNFEQFRNNQDSPEVIPIVENDAVENEQEHYVHKFEVIKEALKMFGIEVTSEVSLRYPWVKDEMYHAAVNELKNGSTYALEYMLGEELLTKDDVVSRGIRAAAKDTATSLIHTLKNQQRAQAAKLFIDTGILSEEETLIASTVH
jgi:hypothetical protein